MPRLLTGLLLGALLAGPALADSVKIGLNYPRTGNYRDEGLELRRGALLAVDEVNRSGGVLGRPLELLGENTASRAEQARDNVDRFADAGARMVFGGATSEEAIAAGQRARERGLLYFATLSYANDVTGSQGHRYLFRESNSAWMSARVLGEYLAWHMPRRRYHYILIDDAWGRSMENALRQATGSSDRARHGRTALPTGLVRRDQYQAALRKAADSDADMLVLVLLGDNLQRSMRMIHNMGLKQRMQVIVPNLTKSVVQQSGPLVMEGVIGTEAWTWDLPRQEGNATGERFVQRYIDEHREYPGSTSASAYAIVLQWADAVRRSGSLDSERLIDALEDHRYTLLKEQQQWRAFDHQNVQSIYAVRVRNREQVMRDPFKQDYFEIIHRMAGDHAAPSLEDWQQERGEQLTLQ
ncbi:MULTISPECIES: ABC transporter substrate-binding protein [unclassified Pseudomonas]|uniref:ABC transporter substrate-binding protein n=1 Tax=unclassified Pseudomonas TaxID=196821 RepID=UPI00244B4DF1|nr:MULTISPECIES: ABC transporter substrate-binding protein [unclassified Pseudomonas]MDG9928826.1 ABC transporter substrate-binding protein [Pseudomonas sp. GD04042]MDH0485665.1 ABC transporter substrate-binding protein [Pseudomonas sp. GD04015]MDH0603267.1 ABC transporter substrate-binding protein [Pseudomonas sp. GD03869]